MPFLNNFWLNSLRFTSFCSAEPNFIKTCNDPNPLQGDINAKTEAINVIRPNSSCGIIFTIKIVLTSITNFSIIKAENTKKPSFFRKFCKNLIKSFISKPLYKFDQNQC